MHQGTPLTNNLFKVVEQVNLKWNFLFYFQFCTKIISTALRFFAFSFSSAFRLVVSCQFIIVGCFLLYICYTQLLSYLGFHIFHPLTRDHSSIAIKPLLMLVEKDINFYSSYCLLPKSCYWNPIHHLMKELFFCWSHCIVEPVSYLNDITITRSIW